MATLEGHTNIVYCVCFNNPYGDKIATGSFDKTAKLWDLDGNCLNTFQGHSEEIVCISFEPQLHIIATGSMDKSSKLWDVETGKMLMDLVSH